jgi:ubiquitin-like protein Pup
MAERIQVEKTTTSTTEETPDTHMPSEAADLSATDDLLDEIDAILEENAEEFVAGYIQKGGQ